MVWKRLLDLTGACAGLLVLSPLLAIIALMIKLDSKGPIFYRGVRTGLHGSEFRIFKFRTMILNAENVGGGSTAKNDPRITTLGKVLRRHKLDELPQLLNVIKGEMSLVGPRPELPRYTRDYTDAEQAILSVRPGITDYASIEFSNLGEVLGDDAPDWIYETKVRPLKNALRLRYVQQRSFVTDVQILLRTLKRLIFG